MATTLQLPIQPRGISVSRAGESSSAALPTSVEVTVTSTTAPLGDASRGFCGHMTMTSSFLFLVAHSRSPSSFLFLEFLERVNEVGPKSRLQCRYLWKPHTSERRQRGGTVRHCVDSVLGAGVGSCVFV